MRDHKANDSLPAGTTLANEISTTDIKDEPCSSKEVHTDHKSIKTDGKKGTFVFQLRFLTVYRTSKF